LATLVVVTLATTIGAVVTSATALVVAAGLSGCTFVAYVAAMVALVARQAPPVRRRSLLVDEETAWGAVVDGF
jgi:hypothetical protein